ACVRVDWTDQCPYCPGWVGYFGYELGRTIETLPSRARRDTDLPDLRLAFYDSIAVHDAIEAKWTLLSLDFDRQHAAPHPAGSTLRNIAKENPTQQRAPSAPVEHSRGEAQIPSQQFTPNFTKDQYTQAVEKGLDYIAAGDIFQVNLSQRLTVDNAPEAADIYSAMARRNPAWYAAFLSFETPGGPCSIVSCSPEMFLSLRGDKVITRPIKGTRGRTGLAEEDAKAVTDLLASEKDNAELAMITDLLRNDLGRLCKYDSVKVVEPRRLETHPTVFHLVSTVSGQLIDGAGIADLLRATFPGGSITGAPKIRAMEIIDEIEPTARAVYTGAIGIICANGSAELNIAIRTAICYSGKAYIQVGGGIVADSNPQDEYEETLHKARGMLEAISLAREHTEESPRS
ncbi:MAG TPA: anthranilate synthase component I family protein, partial [Phycisphaerae bacterium]|nr:anthranilate synthase component I family protein [Phycisphaerae bacterium]